MHTGNPVLVEVIQTYFDKLWEELEKKEQTNNLQKQMTPAKRASIRSVK
jgi:hypothetical protein